MTNFSSTSYRVVIKKSISNEATCRFKTKLALFDSYYRVAKRLLIIAQGDELVDKNNNNASGNNEAKDKKNNNEKNENKMKDEII